MQQPQWDKEQGGRAAYLRSPQCIPDIFSYHSYFNVCVIFTVIVFIKWLPPNLLHIFLAQMHCRPQYVGTPEASLIY